MLIKLKDYGRVAYILFFSSETPGKRDKCKNTLWLVFTLDYLQGKKNKICYSLPIQCGV